jgi:DNA-binding MarR family transcriptional regulator
MISRISTDQDAARQRRRLNATIKQLLRLLRLQLSLLNHHVGTNVDLKDVDLDCLDLISTRGPLGPSALARALGLHPATMTGILDRLEHGGWVVRDRDPSDRRAVVIRVSQAQSGELMRLYKGMNTALDEICAQYQDAELEVIADFLRRTTNAGQSATSALAGT